MDRGYSDYALYGRWTERKVFFVTRLKENACYEVLNAGPLPANRNILADDLIQLPTTKLKRIAPIH